VIPPPSDLEIAMLLIRARRAAGISRAELARRLEIPAKSLALLESGQIPIPASFCLQCCRLLGLNPDLYFQFTRTGGRQ
jgi:transcriptional regulator with XRE-family HTH domain